MESKRLLERAKTSINILHDEILNEFIDIDNNFELIIRRGTYTVSIRYYVQDPWIVVSFPSPFKEEEVLKFFDEQIQNSDFVFGLQSAITSPLTAYNLLHEKDRFIGFFVTTRVFVNGGNIHIKELDQAITAVVAVGALGFTFIAHCIGDKKIEQKMIQDIAKPDPGHMFG